MFSSYKLDDTHDSMAHRLIKTAALFPLHRDWRIPRFLRRWLLKLAPRMQHA